MLGQENLTQMTMAGDRHAPEMMSRGHRWAQERFAQLRRRARWAQWWAGLRGGHGGLHPFSAPQAGLQRHLGLRHVPIAKIIGSEGRRADFDRKFRPLQTRTRDRWASIAVALRQGKALPPVQLLQVGEQFYVRDGHHRISVLRALGQTAVDAEVTLIGPPI